MFTKVSTVWSNLMWQNCLTPSQWRNYFALPFGTLFGKTATDSYNNLWLWTRNDQALSRNALDSGLVNLGKGSFCHFLKWALPSRSSSSHKDFTLNWQDHLTKSWEVKCDPIAPHPGGEISLHDKETGISSDRVGFLGLGLSHFMHHYRGEQSPFQVCHLRC